MPEDPSLQGVVTHVKVPSSTGLNCDKSHS